MLRHLPQTAQRIRHAPGLRGLTPLWDLVRPAYWAALKALGRRRGFPFTIGGHVLRLHPRFAEVGWETMEPESYRAFSDALRPGDVVVDVGANIGTYTIIAAARTGATGVVVAYEPHVETRRLLETHLSWNPSPARVIVRDVCLGASAGETDFYFREGELVTEGKNSRVPVPGFSRTRVAMTTLDEDLTRLSLVPRLLKIDVEGGEWDVLRGAQRTLATHRPTLLVSLHPEALATIAVTPDDILEWLRARGYNPSVIASDYELHVLATPRFRE